MRYSDDNYKVLQKYSLRCAGLSTLNSGWGGLVAHHRGGPKGPMGELARDSGQSQCGIKEE